MRATAVVLVFAFLAVAGMSAARTTPSCAPGGARVLAANHRVAVYSSGGAVYGCDARSGKRLRLGSARVCIAAARVDRAAVAADLAAYGLELCGVDTGSASVLVRRLSDGKRLRSFAALTGSVGPESYQSVNSIVVKRNAAVAWIATVSSIIGRGSRTEVHANGKLLDSGAGIMRSSLRLRGSTLSWRHGSATRSATI